MISRKELLVKIGKIADINHIINDIEKYIITAAEKGEKDIKYMLSDNIIEEDKMTLTRYLDDLGYYVHLDNEGMLEVKWLY